ncbi:hypothetical protein [Aequorivita antarctica]|uniref:Uncharacterized protein n=1 Tax=Aequorivita antarctica TaxID=153266 RepID=A0A5C6Z343_9FLAO|nr:hypothetical protein [Aequorivita antarctica]TXD73923.1 hypothetical protein ESU54_05485 [Aequorivita antarctica]SRX73357.1 hypothetical protein AEQU3_00793 [Aequorivita antarctica]
MSTTIKQPEIEIAKELKELIATQTETESQVIVHINCYSGMYPTQVRIWNNVFLLCKDTGAKSKLLFSDNIAVYPQWTELKAYKDLDFTLVFENLPKECRKFDLIEQIPETGGFFFKDIQRNNSNVYSLEMM